MFLCFLKGHSDLKLHPAILCYTSVLIHSPTLAKSVFGSLRKAYTTNTHKFLKQQEIIAVSDASIQNNGQSRFAWVIAHEAAPLWWGMGLAPGLPKT